MISSNKLIPLEYNTNFFIEKSSLFNIEMSFLKYFIFTTLITLLIHSNTIIKLKINHLIYKLV